MVILVALALLGGPPVFDLQAAFVPAPKPGAPSAVAVTFVAQDPDLRLDEVPAPRLRLDPVQAVLVDRATPPAPAPESQTPRYLDTRKPVNFPVALDPKAARGPHEVKGTVTYFYCSVKQGWCRKGTGDIVLTVDVP